MRCTRLQPAAKRHLACLLVCGSKRELRLVPLSCSCGSVQHWSLAALLFAVSQRACGVTWQLVVEHARSQRATTRHGAAAAHPVPPCVQDLDLDAGARHIGSVALLSTFALSAAATTAMRSGAAAVSRAAVAAASGAARWRAARCIAHASSAATSGAGTAAAQPEFVFEHHHIHDAKLRDVYQPPSATRAHGA